MSIANWCVLTACLLPVLTVGIAKASTAKLSRKAGGYDNNAPREWAKTLTGWQSRASAAQNNGFEALPLFIAGVLMAQQAHANQGTVDTLAMSFIVLRVAYIAAYLYNFSTLRSLIWFAGVGVSISLVALS